jgi:putative GTP pyrophosphokinase
MNDAAIAAAVRTFAAQRPIYAALAEKVAATLEEVLQESGINVHSVTSRVKTPESYAEKLKRKGYKSPDDVTDVAGIRVICYVETDVGRVCDVVKSAFVPDHAHSTDKTDDLGVDRVGYRSIHFTCALGRDRLALPEYKRFDGLLFEIQVRTILQHAWAEIEHDRNYKFSGVLPTQIQRRFAILAGTLEMADREFDSIAAEIDSYAEQIAREAAHGDLSAEVNIRLYGNSWVTGYRVLSNRASRRPSDRLMTRWRSCRNWHDSVFVHCKTSTLCFVKSPMIRRNLITSLARIMWVFFGTLW